MSIDLYYMPLSAPCRSVMLTAKAVGVALNLKMTNLMAAEHLTPEFLKMNPQHTIPTLNDNGFLLNESRAICTYLVQQYAKDDDTLYPKDAKKRAIVDQRMYFDMGTLYHRYAEYYYPVLKQTTTTLESPKKASMDEAIQWLEGFLKQTKYAAADHLTLADFVLIATATTMEATDEHIFDNAPHVKKWMARCRDEIAGHQELNQEGCDTFRQMAKSILAKAKA